MCIFCSILKSEIPAKRFYEDTDAIVIADIKPAAKKHFLVIPRDHYAALSEMNENQTQILGGIMQKIPKIAASLGLENGYRLIINQGADGGQTVPHLHIHILGGEKLP